MTFKIEHSMDGESEMLRLIGRMRAEHLEELQALMLGDARRVRLDLDEVTLVDVEVVRFLQGCQAAGVELCNCSPYIQEWIRRERDQEANE